MSDYTDSQSALVPGDAAECSARRLYASWARSGLQAVLAIAAENAPQFPDFWGRPHIPPDLVYSTVVQRPDRWDALVGQRAEECGWLVWKADVPPRTGGRLAGLPVAVKDVIDVAGAPTRNGTPGGLWRQPQTSAPIWSALEVAGARFVGKSATHEMAWGVTTPQIPHPLDPTRSTGGSSGGSAALVRSGVCAAALGTDTGGSIRIPAALCGVVGFRPTMGSLPMAGITRLAPEQDVAGPLASDLATCVAVLETLLCRPLSRPAAGLPALRVGILAAPGRLQPAVARAYRAALEALRGAGTALVVCDTLLFRRAAAVSLLTMLRSSAREHAAAVRAEPRSFGSEPRALLTLGEGLPEEPITRAREYLAKSTADLFATHDLDAFLTPTTPCVAPVRGADAVDVAGQEEVVSAALTRFTAWAAVTGMPAVSVPAGRDEGMPCAVQVMAPPGREDVCVQVGSLIERLC